VDDAHAAQPAPPRSREECGGLGHRLLRREPVQVEVVLDHPVRAAQFAQDVARQSGTQVRRVLLDLGIVVEREARELLDHRALVLVALSAWQRPGRVPRVQLRDRALLGTPIVCGLIATGVLLAASQLHVHPLALVDAQLGTVVRTAAPLPTGTSGLRVAAGDLNRDGRDEIVVAPGFGGDSTVRVLGPNLVEQSSFRPLGYDGFGFNVAVPARFGRPILARGVNAVFTVRRRLTRTLARFTDAAPISPRFTAQIAWSDGPATPGIGVANGNVVDVRATRRFTRPAGSTSPSRSPARTGACPSPSA